MAGQCAYPQDASGLGDAAQLVKVIDVDERGHVGDSQGQAREEALPPVSSLASGPAALQSESACAKSLARAQANGGDFMNFLPLAPDWYGASCPRERY